MRFFDLHCDTAYKCYLENLNFENDSLAVTPKKAELLTEWRQCFAIFVNDSTEKPFNFYKAALKDFKEKLKNKPHNLTPYFTLEGASLIDSIDKVSELKKDNIRAVTLTWNGENKIAGGVNSDKGLTAFGKEAIKALNKNKIFTDLSHLNEQSFYDVIEVSEYPIATHSNCRALCDHKRNLFDEQIKLIASRQGIIGLCFYPEFLGGDVFESIYQNIFHLLDKGYEDNISIGSDFDGGIMDNCLDGIDKIGALYSFLSDRGLENTLLLKIFYTNALKYFDKTISMI